MRTYLLFLWIYSVSGTRYILANPNNILKFFSIIDSLLNYKLIYIKCYSVKNKKYVTELGEFCLNIRYKTLNSSWKLRINYYLLFLFWITFITNIWNDNFLSQIFCYFTKCKTNSTKMLIFHWFIFQMKLISHSNLHRIKNYILSSNIINTWKFKTKFFIFMY